MIEIRRALPTEAETLTAIALAAKRYWGYPEHWIEIWRPLLTFKPEDIQNAMIVVAVVGSEIAGFYRLFFRERRAILEDLWVRPDFIGRGIGQALFQDASQRGREAGAAVLEVEADPHAQEFYEKMGMRQVGERPSNVDGQRNLPVLEMQL
jgi:ribosomal protein S18 acetylase RimI-like enzyme